MEGSIALFGEKGTVKIGGQYLNELEYSNGIDLEFHSSETKANDYGTYTGSMSNHDKVYDNIMDVFNNNAPVMTHAKEAMKTVEIIQKIYGVGNEVKVEKKG